MLRLKARFSTLFRKSESSCSVANGVGFRFVQRCTGWWSAGTRRADADKACVQGYSWKIIASRPVPAAIFHRVQPLRNAKCHNTACNSKGKRVMTRRFMFPLMVLASSLDAASQEWAKRHPRYFVREIHKGSSWKSPKRKSLPRQLRLHKQILKNSAARKSS